MSLKIITSRLRVLRSYPQFYNPMNSQRHKTIENDGLTTTSSRFVSFRED